jgi:hypothetical protein
LDETTLTLFLASPERLAQVKGRSGNRFLVRSWHSLRPTVRASVDGLALDGVPMLLTLAFPDAVVLIPISVV